MIGRAVFATVLVVVACSVPDLVLDGKRCPCIDGWVCDEPSDTCVRDPSTPDAAMIDGPDPSSCPAGYVAIAGLPTQSRYRFVSTMTTWIVAELDCEDDADAATLPSHLVVIDSAIEQTAVIGGELGGANLDDQWIGLTDLATESTWGYVTAQTPVFTDNPFGDRNDRDCVRMTNTAQHAARDCNDTNIYVCECDGMAGDPARYPNPPDGDP